MTSGSVSPAARSTTALWWARIDRAVRRMAGTSGPSSGRPAASSSAIRASSLGSLVRPHSRPCHASTRTRPIFSPRTVAVPDFASVAFWRSGAHASRGPRSRSSSATSARACVCQSPSGLTAGS
ncbi:hypothetical protein VM98_34065, partial [Streptomyces rubellomurinus subsp. indigoferus]